MKIATRLLTGAATLALGLATIPVTTAGAAETPTPASLNVAAAGIATPLFDAPPTEDGSADYILDVQTVPPPLPQTTTSGTFVFGSNRALGGYDFAYFKNEPTMIGLGCAVAEGTAAPTAPTTPSDNNPDASLFSCGNTLPWVVGHTYTAAWFPYQLGGTIGIPLVHTFTIPSVAQAASHLSAPVVPGRSATLSATFSRDGQHLGSGKRAVLVRNLGGDRYQQLAVGDTDAAGTVQFSIPAAGNYIVGLGSEKSGGPSFDSGKTFIGDQFLVKAPAASRATTLSSPGAVRSGVAFRVTVVASPAAKLPTSIQELRGRTWVTIARSTTATNGRATLTVRLNGRGRHQLRATLPAAAGWAVGTSAVRVVSAR
jgi:hypothetical protein